MSIDIGYLKHNFFYFDKPVEYKLDSGYILNIYPIYLKDSEYFLLSKDILDYDKNSVPDPKVIQMSYLQFLYEFLLKEEINKQKLLNILILCLKIKNPIISFDKNNKIVLIDYDNQDIIISQKQFDDIRRIILYQNLIDYDDEYINPELKKNLDEEMYLKNKNIDPPSLERKIAIISAHTGILKSDQLDMTYRFHSLLFQEVYEESEYNTLYPIIALSGQSDKAEKWIYKNKKEKFADRTVSVSQFNKQAGGTGNVEQKIINIKEEK